MVLTDSRVKLVLEQAAKERSLAKTKTKKKQLSTQSSDSETGTDTPPLTDEEELPDEPRNTCRACSAL